MDANGCWVHAIARVLWQMTLFISPIADLKTASPLALDDDLAEQLAQFDLAEHDGHPTRSLQTSQQNFI